MNPRLKSRRCVLPEHTGVNQGLVSMCFLQCANRGGFGTVRHGWGFSHETQTAEFEAPKFKVRNYTRAGTCVSI